MYYDPTPCDPFRLNEGSSLFDLASRQMEAGDATMTRLYSYINGDGMHLHQQIDKITGEQKFVADHTWTYANVLHALLVRDSAFAIKNEVEAGLRA